MNEFEMVVGIMVVIFGGIALNTWIKTKAKANEGGAPDVHIDEIQNEIERLKERVRVLEKITTDDDRQLSEKIRKLA